jgi:hypothetical protein
MLSKEEEHELRWEDYRRKYGHYPNETKCSHCNQVQKTDTMTKMKDIFTPDFMSTLPPHWGDWLMCDDCSGMKKSDKSSRRKGLFKSGGRNNKPVQLPLKFPNIDSSSISKPRS